MQHNEFDPADWVSRWRDAGGGWSRVDLLRVKSSGDLRALTALIAELNGARRRAVIDHLKATGE
jgi:hypothetical protein